LLAIAPAARAQQSLTKQQQKNLAAFARLFGYVRYFHPSDEAQIISWPMLATKGSRQMLAVQNDAELIKTLNDLFQPLGPTIRVFPTGQPMKFDPAALRPPAAARAGRVVSWQHQGIYTGAGKTYHGVRLGRPGPVGDNTPFATNVDVSTFAGMPYEIDLSWRRGKNSPKATFALTHRQTLGGVENRHATPQRYTNQTVATTGNHYLFKGKIDSAARRLTMTLSLPFGFDDSLNVKAEVIVKGKKILLPLEAGTAGDPAETQAVELVFTSPDLLVEPLFKEQSQLGDYVAREVAPGISCTVPLALAADAAHTYPLGDSAKLDALHLKSSDRAKYPAEWLRYQGERTLGLPEVRLADVVESWNALRHGYAYWGSASVPPDTLLHQTLRRAYADNTTVGFVRTMRLMLAALNDGHAWVTTTFEEPRSYGLPLRFGRAAGRVVVTHVPFPKETPQVRRGDVVEAIDGVPVEQVLAKRASLVSGSPQGKEHQAFWSLASASSGLPATMQLRRGDSLRTATLQRRQNVGMWLPQPPANGWLAPGVYYYNLAKLGNKLTDTEYQTLAKAKAVIFDIRNYPSSGVYTLIPMLLKKPGEVSIIADLDMLKPDQEEVRYQSFATRYTLASQQLPGKMYFLTDAMTQSHPETFLGQVRGLHLGTLVGRPTSGANGGRAELALQGGLSIGYSGERVLNADGSRHHAVGIVPDVLVTPTLESVRLGQDDILDAALKLAQSSK
jgi:C-terminal processing protease CtpA/Prc